MKATSALQAALEWGGWNLTQDEKPSEEMIREYFTKKNFDRMFGEDNGDPADRVGGYSLDECAEAVIQWHAECGADVD